MQAIGRIKLVPVLSDLLKDIFHPNLWRFCDKLYSRLLDPLSVCSVTLFTSDGVMEVIGSLAPVGVTMSASSHRVRGVLCRFTAAHTVGCQNIRSAFAMA